MATVGHSLTGQFRTSSDELSRSTAGDAYRRVQRLVEVFRALVALALLATALLYRDPGILGTRFPGLFIGTALVYSIIGIIWLVYPRTATSTRTELVPVQLCIDLVAVTVLMHASGGISSGIGGLLVVFVGAAALTLRGQHVFLAAAISTLAVLAEQGLSFSAGLTTANTFVPAGVLGAIIFVIASAANPLARRLRESEALARQRGIDLANLAQLNEYIIHNLRESIVVVDEHDNVRLINQSAAEHLGAKTREPGQSLRKMAPDLYRVLRGWRQSSSGFNTMTTFLSGDGTTQINTHIAPLERREDGPVLVFLEDASQLSEKVQQMKLAALGRLSASIAHEIRNPVGALSHAGQLLEEAPGIGHDEQRLLKIIRTNSRRVSEIVENVLQLSRREATRPELIDLSQWVDEFVSEYVSTVEVPETQIEVKPGPNLEVRMDPGHLRQICWNLCDNALEYGGGLVEIGYGRLPGTRRPYLQVADQGPGIPTPLQDQLFEPFATGRTGGTGLGLFISRELCDCNRATLVHEPGQPRGSIFRIVFADPERWGRNT